VADVFDGERVTEIQTRCLYRMKPKLDKLLTQYSVTVVHPVAHRKSLIWIDPVTGDTTKPRSSPKTRRVWDAFHEMYSLRSYIGDPRLTICVVLLDMEEYKLLNGWGPQRKNHASKYDRVPLAIREEYVMHRKEDYMQFVPYELAETFTSKTFGKAARIPRSLAQTVLNILDYMEVVERIGKEGNSYLYQVKY